MNFRYSNKMQALIAAVLTTPGDTDPDLRRAVAARAAELGGRSEGSRGEVPEALAAYVETIAMRAHETTDDQVQALKRAGYSEEAIFEVTLSAALGTAVARLECGLSVLKGGR